MKYIDADLLRKEIDRRYEENREKARYDDYYRGMNDGLDHFEQFLDSLQQEQPMPDSTKLIELWHEDKEMLKEKDFRNDPWRLAYNAFLCGFGRGIAVKKQEQPEVDLEKDIHDQIMLLHVAPNYMELDRFACHFYDLGLKAGKEQKPNKQTEIEIEEAVEKAALEFAYQHPLENGEYGVAKISFMRGAEWQRQQGIVWSEKDEEKKAYDKGFKAAEEFYCGRII